MKLEQIKILIIFYNIFQEKLILFELSINNI